MNKKSGRRSFIKSIGLSSVAAGIPIANTINIKDPQTSNDNLARPSTRTYNTEYTGTHLNRIAFPIGGLGAGMICLEGTGAISHVSVRNRPEIFNEPGWFAGIHIKGITNGSKIIEGPVPDWKKFGLHDAGNGLSGATTGLPHYANAGFKSAFPFAHIKSVSYTHLDVYKRQSVF